jgi:hypothetical protein
VRGVRARRPLRRAGAPQREGRQPAEGDGPGDGRALQGLFLPQCPDGGFISLRSPYNGHAFPRAGGIILRLRRGPRAVRARDALLAADQRGIRAMGRRVIQTPLSVFEY